MEVRHSCLKSSCLLIIRVFLIPDARDVVWLMKTCFLLVNKPTVGPVSLVVV